MPRGGGKSSGGGRSSFGSSTSRSSFFNKKPSNPTAGSKPGANTAAVSRPNVMGKQRSPLMGALMGGMAFGLGSELMRQMFGNHFGNMMSYNILPLLISGGLSYGAYKFMSVRGSKYIFPKTALVFGVTYLFMKGPENLLKNQNIDNMDNMDNLSSNVNNEDYQRRI